MLATELLATGMRIDGIAALCVLLSSLHTFFPETVLAPQSLAAAESDQPAASGCFAQVEQQHAAAEHHRLVMQCVEKMY